MGELVDSVHKKRQPGQDNQGDFRREEKKAKETQESEVEQPKKEEIEIEAFKRSIQAETQKMASAVKSLRDFFEKRSAPAEETTSPPEGLTTDELKELFEDSRKQAEGAKAANELLRARIQNDLEKLFALQTGSREYASAVSSAIQEISGLMSSLQANAVQIPRLEKQAENSFESYKVLRAKEAGYSNMQNLEDGYWEKYGKICDLRRPIFGKWRNRQEIQNLEGELAKMEEIKSLSYRKGYGDEWNFKDQGNVKLLMELAVKKLSEHFQDLLPQNPEPGETKNQVGLLSAEELKSLNDRYVEEDVLRRVEREISSCRSLAERGYREYEERLSALEDPTNVEKLIDLAKQYSDVVASEAPFDERLQFFNQQIEGLPPSLKQNAASLIDNRRKPESKNFEEFASFVLREGPDTKQAIIKGAYRQVLESLQSCIEMADRGNDIYLENLRYDLSNRLWRLEVPESGFDMEKFLVGLDMDKWEAFKNNPQMIAHFGQESLDASNRQIGQEVKKRILQLPDHTDKCIKLGEKLYHFKEAEYAPLAILNAYREAGYSGERPFIPVLGGYLKSLDPQEMEKLKAMNIPGCAEIMDLSVGKQEDDTYQKIQENLGKMSIFFLQQDHKMDFYLMGLLDYLQADIGQEGNELVAQILADAKDEKTRSAAFECALIRIRQGDVKTVAALGRTFDGLPENIRLQLRQQAGDSIQGLVNSDALDEKTAVDFGRLLDRPAQEMKSLLSFLGMLKKNYYFHDGLSQDQMSAFIKAAENPDVLIGGISEITRIFPDFRYFVNSSYRSDVQGKSEKKVFHLDPFECLMRQKSPEELFPIIAITLEKEGAFRQEFSNGLLRSLREFDPLLMQNETSLPEPSNESYVRFHEGLQDIIRESCTPEGKLQEYAYFFQNKNLLRFIARQPEKISGVIKLPETIPHLFQLLQPGGPLNSNKESVLKNIFENGDAVRKAKEVTAIFEKRVPYWRQLFLFTDSRIGEQLAAATSAYPITEVAGAPLANIVRRHVEAKNENPEIATTLESMIANPALRESVTAGSADSVPFSSFSGMYKRLIFRDYLRRTIETSRSEQAKAVADGRNRLLAASPFAAMPGSYIHGSSIDVMGSVLLNGNLPQEALGENAGTDSYPFQVDFTKLKADYLEKQESVPDIFDHSISKGYGVNGSLGQDGQLFYIYDRSKSSWEQGKDYATSPDSPHTLIFGGMPSTEVTGIVLRNADAIFSKAKQAILENGCYIPAYDINGRLLMSPEEYDQARHEGNLEVPVEIWDYSLKTGDQLGSNAGGEFTVPERGGPAKYYVKFGKDGSNESLWNEQLSDNLYRVAGLDVPDTKVVGVEGSFGHASRLIDGREPSSEEYRSLLGSGFVMDCWLANWDVAAKPDNVIIDAGSGRLSRIDNGGALLFRAQGDRKPDFGKEVIELETMRGGYPGLTPSDINQQIAALRETFTDGVIDQQVDGVRLSQADRDYLKTTLHQRRDYIVSYFENAADSDVEHLSDEGKEIPGILQSEQLDDERLATLMPEWGKLVGEAGYQHNGALLGGHIKEALAALVRLPEYEQLDPKERELAAISALFHDIAKPTGRQNEQIVRDFSHEIPSAQLAASYMLKWGFSRRDIQSVAQVILFDGVISDIARGKVRDQAKNLTPEQMRSQLDSRAVRILRALNRADVIATVGEDAFNAIAPAYNEYFEKLR